MRFIGSSGILGGRMIFKHKFFDNLNRKKLMSRTPLEVALKALILALNDSAEALVL
jgi:hypothetical protein